MAGVAMVTARLESLYIYTVLNILFNTGEQGTKNSSVEVSCVLFGSMLARSRE